MALLIRGREYAFPADIRTWMRNPDVMPVSGEQTGLDPELRLLVQRCIAENPLNRPRPEELLAAVSNAVMTKQADNYSPGNTFESDTHIQKLVKDLILNGDTSS